MSPLAGFFFDLCVLQWNHFNPDTLETEESVLISGVKLYTNMVFGTAKSVLFIEVSSFQGVLIRGVLLYVINRGIFTAE